MRRHLVFILGVTLVAAAGAAIAAAAAGTFTPTPIAPDQGVDRLNRAVARERVGRDLFGEPYATVTLSNATTFLTTASSFSR